MEHSEELNLLNTVHYFQRLIKRNSNKEYLLLMDTHNSDVMLVSGTDNSVDLEFSDVEKFIQKRNRKEIIILHNHPNDSIRPSKSDKHAIKKVQQFINTRGTALKDFVITGTKGIINYYSFKEEGLI